jgi:2',3'-cyclic-nucleotide 2'-phosphodiesterase
MRRPFRLLFIGDVILPPSCSALQALVPALRRELRLDAVIANGENSAPGGFGITDQTAAALLSVVDFVTLGDHAFDQPDTGELLEREPRIVRPANFEEQKPGRGWGVFEVAGVRVGVANLLGQLFMRPKVTSPFEAADQVVSELKAAGANLIVLDLQAEATSEKQGMGWHLAGRATAVLGTHTHTPTADARILPGGTAYITDVGMTGGVDGVIGFDRDFFARLFAGEKPSAPPERAAGPLRMHAVLIEADVRSGQALDIHAVVRDYHEPPGA